MDLSQDKYRNPYASPDSDPSDAANLENQETKIIYASFWSRFFAIAIDIIILRMVLLPAEVAYFLLIDYIAGPDTILIVDLTYGPYHLFGLFLFVAFYFSLQESWLMQATLGKKALGLKVVNEEGAPASLFRALCRFLAKIISTLLFYGGFLMQPYTEHKQAMHDLLAGTLVIRA